MAPVGLTEHVCIQGKVQVHRKSLCFLHGGVKYGRFIWRFTALDLFERELGFHVTFDGLSVGTRWDRISLPRGTKNGFVEMRPITRILAGMIAVAFGRTESALNDNELRLVQIVGEDSTLTGIGSEVDLKIWIHHAYLNKKKV